MIEMLREVTDWDYNNGVYHVNAQGQLVQHNDKVFINPLKGFSKARRKFEKLGEYPDENTREAIEVKGSNGKIYYIIDGKCSCPGFKFRGTCKHIENISK